jgi:hypothetical protein
MSGPNHGDAKHASSGMARFAGRFLLEWALLVGVGVVISIVVDAAWSLIRPETAEGALLKLRQGLIPWALATFVGMAVYKFLKRDKNATFIDPSSY